ncbi:hypothetical protein ACHMW6_06315 [Pseudoduganella sp. UC29_106]|uniref:hypothetical protein n=1 Tax=Pseudoduganella sp. UC29_106 TaxID=3374553 RepID=UPI003756433F
MGVFDQMVKELQKTEPAQRVPDKIEVVAERGTPYQQVMKVWRQWQGLSDRQESGGWSHPQDSKELMATGEAVEAMVNDLPRVQWWAVRKAHGISPAAWRFPNADYAGELLLAEDTLTAKMQRNVNTKRYFMER